MNQFCSRRIDLTPINYFLRPETRYHHPHQSSQYDAFLSQARDHCFTRLAKMRRNTVTYWTAVFANRETCSLIRLNDAFQKTLQQATRKKPRKLTDHGKTTSTAHADFKFDSVLWHTERMLENDRWRRGGRGVGKNENSIINTFFSVHCSLLGLFRTKNIIRKRNGQVMNKRQMRPGGTFLQIQTDIYIYI